MSNRISKLFNIQYPIIQGGMVWCSGYELVSAVSNAGGLGLLSAGSMYPDILKQQIKKVKANTNKPFGVNLPLIYTASEEYIKVILEEKVPVVFTSAGNPKTYTSIFQEAGIKVAHVVASSKFALKAEEAGVDAITVEGFEAGGHNGREETTSLTLIPSVKKTVNKPIIAAGGIATGRGMLASMILGAEGVQIGTRFVASHECSAHPNFKQTVLNVKEGDTKLMMKKHIPVRLIMNEFARKVETAELQGASREEIIKILGKGRAKKGIFEGDQINGELEIGQIASIIDKIQPVAEIINEIISEYKTAKAEIAQSENFNF